VPEPFVQLGAAIGFSDKLYAIENLGKSHHADMELLQRLVGDKCHDPRFRFWPPKL